MFLVLKPGRDRASTFSPDRPQHSQKTTPNLESYFDPISPISLKNPTKETALDLQQSLLAEFTSPSFQKTLHAASQNSYFGC